MRRIYTLGEGMVMKRIWYLCPLILVLVFCITAPENVRAEEITDLKQQLEAAKELIRGLGHVTRGIACFVY